MDAAEAAFEEAAIEYYSESSESVYEESVYEESVSEESVSSESAEEIYEEPVVVEEVYESEESFSLGGEDFEVEIDITDSEDEYLESYGLNTLVPSIDFYPEDFLSFPSFDEPLREAASLANPEIAAVLEGAVDEACTVCLPDELCDCDLHVEINEEDNTLTITPIRDEEDLAAVVDEALYSDPLVEAVDNFEAFTGGLEHKPFNTKSFGGHARPSGPSGPKRPEAPQGPKAIARPERPGRPEHFGGENFIDAPQHPEFRGDYRGPSYEVEDVHFEEDDYVRSIDHSDRRAPRRNEFVGGDIDNIRSRDQYSIEYDQRDHVERSFRDHDYRGEFGGEFRSHVAYAPNDYRGHVDRYEHEDYRRNFDGPSRGPVREARPTRSYGPSKREEFEYPEHRFEMPEQRRFEMPEHDSYRGDFEQHRLPERRVLEVEYRSDRGQKDPRDLRGFPTNLLRSHNEDRYESDDDEPYYSEDRYNRGHRSQRSERSYDSRRHY